MRHLLIAIVAALLAMSTACTTNREAIAQRTYQDSIDNIVAKRLIDERAFVLTANRVTIGHSPSISVTENTNFVLVDGNTGIVQISPRIGGGPNGVGGVTASGTISGYKVETTKKGNTIVKFHLTATIGSADIIITLIDKSTTASATVDATFHRGRATLNGRLGPLAANYFKGRSR